MLAQGWIVMPAWATWETWARLTAFAIEPAYKKRCWAHLGHLLKKIQGPVRPRPFAGEDADEGPEEGLQE